MAELAQRHGREIGLALVFGLGVGLFGLHIWHAAMAGEDFRTVLFGVFFPALFSVGLIAGGVSVWHSDTPDRFVLRTALWTLFGAIVFVVTAVLVILYQREEGVVMSDQLFMAINGASGGSIGGFVMGLYDQRQRRAQQESERLNDHLTVLNRVLRHDIRNRANVLKWHTEALEREPENAREKVEAIRQQADEIVNLGEKANRIEQLVHSDDTELEVVDVGAFTETIAEQVREDRSAVDVTVSLADAPPAYAHPLITTAVANVIENAIEHNDSDQPRVRTETATVHREGVEFVELRIADNGPGIPGHEVAALERGFETDLEHTSGLGLWLVYWILEASDGEVELDTDAASGTLVTLRLRAAPDAEPTMTSPGVETEELLAGPAAD